MLELREKLEKVFAERAMVQAVVLDRMSLAELLYHAVVECGESCQLMNNGALQGA